MKKQSTDTIQKIEEETKEWGNVAQWRGTTTNARGKKTKATQQKFHMVENKPNTVSREAED